ncbi:hypothetical protein ElyMa_005905600 [Elysia marginata]|uniref:Uncharacterized protein n=1 Tax=Elysia marginata TaxID=1093978 RepID=A0AAV4G588_9GAST|nr:hypothetical protein ElyMa_005905600 [Elysia marginata]
MSSLLNSIDLGKNPSQGTKGIKGRDVSTSGKDTFCKNMAGSQHFRALTLLPCTGTSANHTVTLLCSIVKLDTVTPERRLARSGLQIGLVESSYASSDDYIQRILTIDHGFVLF